MSQLSPVTILGGFSWIPTTRTALVDPPVLMFARTGAPKPMEKSCCLEKERKIIRTHIQGEANNSKNFCLTSSTRKGYYLSEIVFSKSTDGPPQMKSIFLESICYSSIVIRGTSNKYKEHNSRTNKLSIQLYKIHIPTAPRKTTYISKYLQTIFSNFMWQEPGITPSSPGIVNSGCN